MQRRSLAGYALVAVGTTAWAAVAVAVGADPVAGGSFAAAAPFLVLFGTGVGAWWLRPEHPATRRLLLAGTLIAVAVGGSAVLDAAPRFRSSAGGWGLGVTVIVAADLGLAALADLFCTFPDGRYPGPRTRLFTRAAYSAAAVSATLTAMHPRPPVPLSTLHPRATVRTPFGGPLVEWVAGLPVTDQLLFVLLPAALVAMAFRYRGANGEARAQLRWPMAGIGALAVALVVSWTGVLDLLPLSDVTAQLLWTAALSAVPLGLLVGIVRHRLFDLDLLIRHSASYGLLWLLIALGYAVLAAVPGIAAGRQLSPAVAALVTIAVAMVFQPVRHRLERVADRLVFGERIGGYALIKGFGALLENSVPPAEIAARVAVAARRGLDARWARVWILAVDGARTDLVATDGEAGTSPVVGTDLVAAGETIGWLQCGPRRRGAHTSADEELLHTFGRQAALALANSVLADRLEDRLRELGAQGRELAASRARIVAAEAAGRRRLERDLHDGVQQQLVSLMARLSVARTQLPGRPDAAAATLLTMQAEFRETVADLRDLARGIHPAVLTDQGLLPAVEALAARLPLPVSIDCAGAARAGPLQQQVEAAAYFGVAEALTNVLKHADARHAWVRVADCDGGLAVEVGDDGRGFDPAAATRRGLDGLRDRLEALGGSLVVSSGPTGPTTVRMLLPAGGLSGV